MPWAWMWPVAMLRRLLLESSCYGAFCFFHLVLSLHPAVGDAVGLLRNGVRSTQAHGIGTEPGVAWGKAGVVASTGPG